MQTTAIRTVANSLPKNEVILLTLLISKRYIPYTELRKIFVVESLCPDFPEFRFAERESVSARFLRRFLVETKKSLPL